jgi:hypothetical protein
VVGGHAEADRLGAAGGGGLDLGELVVGGGEADLEPFGFPCPALAFGLGDAGGEVAADFPEPLPRLPAVIAVQSQTRHSATWFGSETWAPGLAAGLSARL